ncbi:LADA_0B05160g1_1 [Lachancea dasiensis]|uniref:LADA_0B05160g1_1 n=1 Tax=Lachancea dasiensis TaxID=1072105 RepID=A0A1G4IT99_9SACH|nr:LADA_0B05160g1_1 [Lachancea dasiensis]
MAQYIGKTISLISVTDNRYVGLLEGIDSERGVVTLNKVRCFGTEGRKHWGPQEIYPNPTVYDTVTFNGNDVKDLSILDVALEEVQPVLPPQSVATQQQRQPRSNSASEAPPSAQAPQTVATQEVQDPPQTSQQLPAAAVPAAMAGYGVYAPSASAPETQEQATKVLPSPPLQQQRNQRDGNRQPKPSGKSQQGRQETPQRVEIPTEDFDFLSNNSKLERDHTTSRPQPTVQGEAADTEGNFYNRKSSFFDTISTSTETNTNMRWQEERQLNMDTFGQASAGNRRGRGGARGGRGSYRGRGGQRGGNRGGFRKNTNQYGGDSATEKIEF